MRRRAYPLLLALGPAALLLVLGALLLAVRLPGLKDDLAASRSSLVAAQDALRDGDLTGARSALSRAQTSSRQAADTVHGGVWRLYAHVPVVSTTVRELQAVADAVDVTTHAVLPPLLELDDAQPPWRGRVDPAPFVRLQRPLNAASTRLTAVRAGLRTAPRSRISPITDARGQLDAALSRLATSVSEARVAALTVPGLVAGDKTYLLAVQNNAEPRATGGLLGSYGSLAVADGAFDLTHVGPNNELVDPTAPVVQLGEEYDRRYGRFATTSTWRSANLSPDVPTAGRILAALSRAQFGIRVDGVVFVDPVALSDLLDATGPVTLDDGTRLTSANAVQVLLVDAYRRFPERRDAERNAYLSQAAREVVATLRTPGTNAKRLARAVAKAASSGHLQVWSADPRLQALLATSRVGGALSTKGPLLSVVTQDVGGSKLGAYLRREVTYVGELTGEATDLGRGPAPEERATVTVRLTNDAPADLPPYVTARPDDPKAPVGQAHYWLSVYLGEDATLLSATLDGRPVLVESATEKGLSVFSRFVEIDRGASVSLVLEVRQPASTEQPLVYRQQPLLRPDALRVDRRGAPLERYYAE